MRSDMYAIVSDMYRDLRPRAPLPELSVEFFAYTGLNNTIRLRRGKLLVRFSDVLEGAPEHVLRSISHILLDIMYHEMLHLRHPVKLKGSRRCVHSPEFQAEEKLFPHLEQARSFLRRL